MFSSARGVGVALVALLSGVGPGAAALAAGEWLQWGGPHRNFTCDSRGLAASWPEAGPRKLWSREFGDGYSTILVDGDTLYTMCRDGDSESVVALSAADGATKWEFKYPAPFVEKEMDMSFGPGPHSTPLIVGDRIFSVGVTDVMHCLSLREGKPLWSHDLHNEFGGNIMGRGYSCSPLAWKDTVIVSVGGKECGLIAFKQSDGAVAWKSEPFGKTAASPNRADDAGAMADIGEPHDNSHASPILITLGGREQLVMFTTKELTGIDPADGKTLWAHPHTTQFGANIATPIWCGDDLIFCSCAYSPGGSRLVRLNIKDGKVTPEEVWYSRTMRIHHGNAIRLGDRIYGSSGDFGPAFLTTIDLKTGKSVSRERGLKKATCLAADGKLIVLDEDGVLALAEPTGEGVKIVSRVDLLENRAWTVPTLVGTRLYVRDRKTLMALDIGPQQG